MNLKLAFAKVTFPLHRMFWWLWRKALRYKCLSIQNCNFYGPPEFLRMAANAMQGIYKSDITMYNDLVSGHYCFWEEPAGFVSFRRHCGISRAWLEWKEQGIISCIADAFFHETILYSEASIFDNQEKTKLIKEKVSLKTRAWMNQHQVPKELSDCFKRTGSNSLRGQPPRTEY